MPALGGSSTCEDVLAAYPQGAAALRDATVIITGCNTGIGKYTARAIASTGANTVLACRSMEKAEAAAAEIAGAVPSARLHCIRLDLSSLAAVSDFAAEFRRRRAAAGWPPLRLLVLNAGLMSHAQQATREGYELTWGTNHLGHFHLTNLLLGELRAAAPSRVVVVSSESHRGPLSTKQWGSRDVLMAEVVRPTAAVPFLKSYSNSKLANVFFASELHRREAGNGVAACSLHPGAFMATEIGRGSAVVSFLMRWVLAPFTKNMSQGSATTVACGVMPHDQLQGRYFNHCSPQKSSKLACDEDAAALHWRISEELTAKVAARL